MKVFEGLTSLFKETDEDEEVLEKGYEEEEAYEEPEEPVAEKPRKSGGLFSSFRKPEKESEEEEFYYQDEEPEEKRPVKPAPARTASTAPQAAPRSYASEKVVPLRSSAAKKMEVVVIHPKSLEDGNEITDTLLSGRAVVLNLEGISPDVAQRIIDYSAGSCYAMRGSLQKITNYIFLVAPSSVDISGDFQDMLGSGVDLSTTYQGNYQF